MSKTKIKCPKAVFCTASAHECHNKTTNIGLGLVLHSSVIIQFAKASHFLRKGLRGQDTNMFKSQPFSDKLLEKMKGKGSFFSTHRADQSDRQVHSSIMSGCLNTHQQLVYLILGWGALSETAGTLLQQRVISATFRTGQRHQMRKMKQMGDFHQQLSLPELQIKHLNTRMVLPAHSVGTN